MLLWGTSSIGGASRLHREGSGFEPLVFHLEGNLRRRLATPAKRLVGQRPMWFDPTAFRFVSLVSSTDERRVSTATVVGSNPTRETWVGLRLGLRAVLKTAITG